MNGKPCGRVLLVTKGKKNSIYQWSIAYQVALGLPFLHNTVRTRRIQNKHDSDDTEKTNGVIYCIYVVLCQLLLLPRQAWTRTSFWIVV